MEHGSNTGMPIHGKCEPYADRLCSLLDKGGFMPEDSAGGLTKRVGKKILSNR